MATEILRIPEEHLREVIRVIRSGLEHVDVSEEVHTHLRQWCCEEEQYLDDAQSI